MGKRKRLAPGEPVTFKLPVSCTEEQIKLINQWRDLKVLSKKVMEKIDQELGEEQKLSLPISRPLTPEEMERLANPEIQKMLGNLCLALLSQQIPTLPVVGVPTATEQSKKPEEQPQVKETAQEWEVPEEVDDLIDDLLDDL